MLFLILFIIKKCHNEHPYTHIFVYAYLNARVCTFKNILLSVVVRMPPKRHLHSDPRTYEYIVLHGKRELRLLIC